MPTREDLIRIFRAVRLRLAPDGAWTQRSNARDRKGHPEFFDSTDATCWCLEGAMRKESANWQEFSYALHEVAQETGGVPCVWNDVPGRTQDEALWLLDRLLTKLEAADG